MTFALTHPVHCKQPTSSPQSESALHRTQTVDTMRQLWIILHGLLAVSVITSLLTGFRIATQQHTFLHWLKPILPQGEVFSVHMLSAGVFSSLVITYCILLIFRVRTQTVLLLRKPPITNRWDYHRLVQVFGLVICVFAFTSGVLIHFFQDSMHIDHIQNTLSIDFLWVRYTHLIIAVLFVLYIFMHAASYFVLGGVSLTKKMFIPSVGKNLSKYHFRLISYVVVFISAVVLLDFCFNGARWFAHKLEVTKIFDTQWIDIDGRANDSAWKEAQPIKISTFGGVGFFNGNTEVMIKSVHNAEEIYFNIRWKDSSKSNIHLPIVKTHKGWKVLHDGFQYFNETKYYEDKLAILVSESCSIAAAGTAHLGQQPLKNMPANWHGKGYHYSKNSVKHDLWQWKAVRTNGKKQADDNYIGPPEPATYSSRRYTAGYQQDAKLSGAYVMNWQWFKPEGITPKRLPKNHLFTSEEKTQISQPSDFGAWFDYAAYRPELDKFSIGLVIPSVLYRSNQFEGDRGDVYAKGRWQDGWWSLELVRKKNTQSVNDVQISDGVCIWVAAFDHAQIGHTRHLRPIEIKFK